MGVVLHFFGILKLDDPGSTIPRPVRHFTLWLEAGHPWDVLQLPSSRSQHSASA